MSSSRRTVLIVVILLLSVLLALGNMLCHALVVQELTGMAPPTQPGLLPGMIHMIGASLAQRPQFVWFFTGAPLLVGLIVALLIGFSGAPRAEPQGQASGADADPEVDGALRLLALLQQEGRLIDFLEEDIEPYGDAQIGAAVRAIHAGCRSALRQRMRIERIFPQDDGTPVAVEAGFDATEVRLTGNVHGNPPFQGVLQHGGWRVSEVSLPKSAGVDATVLTPAEVEIA